MDTDTREVIIRANGAIAALRQMGAADAPNSIAGVMADLTRTVHRLSRIIDGYDRTPQADDARNAALYQARDALMALEYQSNPTSPSGSMIDRGEAFKAVLDLRDNIRGAHVTFSTTDEASRLFPDGDRTSQRDKFDHAVAVERARQIGKGYTPEHDREHGLEHLHAHAYEYAARGRMVETAALIVAAQVLVNPELLDKDDRS